MIKIVNIHDKIVKDSIDKNNTNLIQSSNGYVYDNNTFYELYQQYVIWSPRRQVTLLWYAALELRSKIYEMLAKPQIRPLTKPKLFYRGIQRDVQ